MSIGSSLSGITFAGLGSGIDTNSIVDRLIQLEQIPIRRLQQRQAELTQRMGIFNQLRTRAQALSSAANTLNSASAYNPSKAASSDAAVATASASSGAVAGTYNLSVYQLAQANKLGSSAQASVSAALNLSGSFTVNGKSISVLASDSLTTIAQKINSATGADVSAGVIDGGAGQGYLTLTSTKSGRNNQIDLVDTSGGVLAALGVLPTSLRNPIAGGAATFGFSSSSARLGDLLEWNDMAPTTVSIGAETVQVTADDTLDTLASKLNGLGTVTASVVTQVVNGETVKRLEITGETSFGTEGNFWLNMGLLKRTNEIVAAQDAKFQIDGVALSNSSNTLTTVIPNVTVNLLKADASDPESTTLTITRDTDQTKKSMKTFVDAVNGVIDFIRENSKFDKDTFDAGILFGDSTASQIESNLADTLFRTISNNGGIYSSFTELGIAFDKDGRVTLDESVLDAAITSNPESVGSLMRSVGSSTSAELTFIGNSPTTRASGPSGYEVNITQLSTKTTFTSAVGQTSGNVGGEVLTFSGAIFGSDYQLAISAGLTATQTKDLINNDSKLKDLVVADVVAGKLVITSKRYGTPGAFSVVSNQDAAIDNSGVGRDANLGTLVAGVNVAGTINGRAATGSGQFLTSASADSNKDADGLQIQYTGSTTGIVGYVKFSKGVAANTYDLVQSYTDAVSGLLTSNDQSLQTQYDDLGTNITALTERASQKQLELRAKFAAMEQAISQLQAQQARMQAMLQK